MSGRNAGPRVRAHVWISGRVQGVYFRAYAEDEAAFRKVAGWVRNARTAGWKRSSKDRRLRSRR